MRKLIEMWRGFWGFFRPLPTTLPSAQFWGEHDEWFVAREAEVKARRLAQIAVERSAIKDRLTVAKRQKRARKHMYARLEELRREELRLETGL